jgi:hypothetical protein
MISLGVSHTNVGYTWIGGSTIILLTDPYVGALSDYW